MYNNKKGSIMVITGKGTSFKEWREALGMDQADVALIFGCHKATIANYEKDQTPIPLKVLTIIGKISGSDKYIIGKRKTIFKNDETCTVALVTTVELLTRGPNYRKKFLHGS